MNLISPLHMPKFVLKTEGRHQCYKMKCAGKVQNNLWRCLVLLLTCSPFCAAQQNVGNVFKRQEFDDYRSCARNFEIHQDKIIRTEESKKMGAKYLNGKEVTSKDECIKFCCRTPNCNVFVLEEKVFNQQQGTCYLFECGSSDNFKCKFTRHHNYSSAVFIASRPQLLLEDEIQFTQHERELTSLRHGVNGTKSKNCATNTKNGSADQSNINEIAQEPPKNVEENNEDTIKKSGRCSRFQFECRSSGECIAIYNACDGIPQCADHSDEDAELGCPTNVPAPPKKSIEDSESIIDHSANDNTLAHNTGIEDPARTSYINKNNLESQSGRGVQSVDQNFINHRIPGSKINPWQSKLNQPLYRPSHNYNHKPNAMNMPYNFGEYGNSELNSMYDNYNANNYNYNNDNNENRNRNVELKTNNYQSNGNPWRGKLSLISELDPKNSEVYGNRPAPEFYYEDNNMQFPNKLNGPNMSPENAQRNEQHRNMPIKVHHNGTAKSANSNLQHQSTEVITAIAANSSTTAPVIISAASSISTATKMNAEAGSSKKSTIQHEKQSSAESAQPVTIKEEKTSNKDSNESQVNEENSKQNAHRKLEKELSAEVPPAQDKFFDVKSGDYRYTQHPSGAFVSLSLGICVTAVMVFVVAYRLKIVRKRIRRGKLPYAHDADFLVNGMYL